MSYCRHEPEEKPQKEPGDGSQSITVRIKSSLCSGLYLNIDFTWRCEQVAHQLKIARKGSNINIFNINQYQSKHLNFVSNLDPFGSNTLPLTKLYHRFLLC